MNAEKAQEVGNRLAREVGAGSEDAWAFWVGLRSFPSEAEQVWEPRTVEGMPAAAHWIDGHVLFTATSGEESIEIEARPVSGGSWHIQVSCKSGRINDGGFATAGLISDWKFTLPGGETFEVQGEEVLPDRDSHHPNAAQLLALGIAEKMLRVESDG